MGEGGGGVGPQHYKNGGRLYLLLYVHMYYILQLVFKKYDSFRLELFFVVLLIVLVDEKGLKVNRKYVPTMELLSLLAKVLFSHQYKSV
jgi:hypothetical protein